jgi:hypothetical protein
MTVDLSGRNGKRKQNNAFVKTLVMNWRGILTAICLIVTVNLVSSICTEIWA